MSMKWNRATQQGKFGALACLLVVAAAQSALAQWTQFGGSHRNFKADSAKLADVWSAEGPKKLWTRELGDGYATIVVDGDHLYTMYRKVVGEKPETRENVACLDAKSGKTVWEHAYEAPKFEGQDDSFGWGPNPTPLIVGDRVFTAGYTGKFHCLDKKSGKVIWSHDLAKEYEFTPDRFGYSISPTAYKDMVLMVTNGKDATVVAFKQSDGTQVYKALDFRMTHSTPILIQHGGKDQLVVLAEKEMIGVDPANGTLLWQHPTPDTSHMASPVWDGDDIIFCSSAYGSGSRAVKLTDKDGKTTPEELWFTKKVYTQFGNSIRLGDYVYAPSGQDGPGMLACMDVKTGDVKWRERGFAKATLCYADNKMIVLDEEGQLGLARVSPEKFEVLSKCKISDTRCWSAPTVVGNTMYVRDRKSIMAFDLS